MTRYAMLTHEPERLRLAYGNNGGWSVTPLSSAVEALVWEQRLRKEGVILLDSRGWRFGVEFTLVAAGDPAVTNPPAPATQLWNPMARST